MKNQGEELLERSLAFSKTERSWRQFRHSCRQLCTKTFNSPLLKEAAVITFIREWVSVSLLWDLQRLFEQRAVIKVSALQAQWQQALYLNRVGSQLWEMILNLYWPVKKKKKRTTWESLINWYWFSQITLVKRIYWCVNACCWEDHSRMALKDL